MLSDHYYHCHLIFIKTDRIIRQTKNIYQLIALDNLNPSIADPKR